MGLVVFVPVVGPYRLGAGGLVVVAAPPLRHLDRLHHVLLTLEQKLAVAQVYIFGDLFFDVDMATIPNASLGPVDHDVPTFFGVVDFEFGVDVGLLGVEEVLVELADGHF